MPTYTCTYRSGLLDGSTKARVASAITSAHSEVTDAPPYFAQVIFNEVPSSNQFIGGHPVDHDHVFVFGHIRAGRSSVDRKELIKRLTTDIAKEVGAKSFSVWAYIHELPPAAMVEFGHILPGAGDEAAWEASLPQDDAERMKKIGRHAGR